MLSRDMRVIKEMSFLLKPKESLIDLQLNLLEIREPFNTGYGFMCRFIHISSFFKDEQDAFTFLNVLYGVVYGGYLFNSLSELKVYMDSIPEYKDSDYYRIINNEIVDLVNIEML
jgi:hypothetical protein